jgi:hypothetical protein
MPGRSRRRVVLVGLLLGVPALTACGSTSSSPRPGADAGATVVRITATPSGCPPVPSRIAAGAVEVIATNLDAPTISEVEVRSSDLSRVLGEKENLIQGMSAKFSISLGAGRFVVNCPGAAQAHWTLDVARASKKVA